MKYAQHRSSQRQKRTAKRGGLRWVLLLLLLAGFAVVLALTFTNRGESSQVQDEELQDGADSGDALEAGQSQGVAVESGGNILESIELDSLVGAQFGGTARRGIEEGIFSHTIVADLPDIDTSIYFYEGWLVKPGVTEFFSTGEMFARADGKWGLVWEESLEGAREDVLDFTKVVITKEARDGDPAPSVEHVLEGSF